VLSYVRWPWDLGLGDLGLGDLTLGDLGDGCAVHGPRRLGEVAGVVAVVRVPERGGVGAVLLFDEQ
jgi:hypothetical protein